MEPLRDDERAGVLRALLDENDQPGDQVGWQLAQHAIGDAFVDADARCALVIAGRFAVVYGAARPIVGRFLYDRIFVGTAQGALASLDPTPVVDGIDDEFGLDQVRVFFETDTVQPSHDADIAPLVCRRPAPPDDAALLASQGAWVTEMWARPSDATYVRGLYDSDDGVLGLAASYAVSPRYAEIAAWVDDLVAGHRIVASQAESFLGEVLSGGHRISSAIMLTNQDARRFASGAGWRPVAEQRVVAFAPPPAGSSRAWELLSRP